LAALFSYDSTLTPCSIYDTLIRIMLEKFEDTLTTLPDNLAEYIPQERLVPQPLDFTLADQPCLQITCNGNFCFECTREK